MERELPTIEIEGTQYKVDVSARELRQVGRPDKRLYFDQMMNHQTHYTLEYDRSQKKRANSLTPPGHIRIVVIPPLVKLDPVGMAQKYGVTLESLSGKTDHQVMCDDAYLEARLRNQLPRIDLRGDAYVIDLAKRELRYADDPTIRIDLNTLPLSRDGARYAFYYSPVTKEVYKNELFNLKLIPAGADFIEIPDMAGLDPIGFAREYPDARPDYIRKCPPDSRLSARTIPFAEVRMPMPQETIKFQRSLKNLWKKMKGKSR